MYIGFLVAAAKRALYFLEISKRLVKGSNKSFFFSSVKSFGKRFIFLFLSYSETRTLFCVIKGNFVKQLNDVTWSGDFNLILMKTWETSWTVSV